MDEQDQARLEQRRKKRIEQKRKRLMRQRIIYAVMALIVILIIVLSIHSCTGKQTQTETGEEQQLTEMSVKELKTRAGDLGIDLTGLNKKEEIIAAIESYIAEQNAAQETEEEEGNLNLELVEENTTATLTAVGDLMVYDTQIADAETADATFDFSACFQQVAEYLSASDLTVGNLECNFCGSPYSGYPNFNAPESLATTLHNVGFDILQTANTYSIQNGLSGLTSTYKYVAAAGMDPIGTYYTEADKTDYQGVLLKEVNGIKIAFIAYTKGVNNMYLPDGSEWCVDILYKDYYSNYSQIDTDSIKASIDDAKELEADVIVAMVHWGSEQELEPSSSQEQIAELMFENGVDVILGTHSHIVGPMEKRTVTTTAGEEKEVFIAYSLGNFIGDMEGKDYTQYSVILNMEFTKDAAGDTTISSVSYIPVYFTGAAGESTYQVLDTRDAIDKYVGGAEGCVSDDVYNDLKLSLDVLHANAGAEFDATEQ